MCRRYPNQVSGMIWLAQNPANIAESQDSWFPNCSRTQTASHAVFRLKHQYILQGSPLRLAWIYLFACATCASLLFLRQQREHTQSMRWRLFPPVEDSTPGFRRQAAQLFETSLSRVSIPPANVSMGNASSHYPGTYDQQSQYLHILLTC